MKKSTKVLLGIATMWPILYIFLFFAAIILLMAFAPNQGGGPGSPPESILLPMGFMGLMVVHLATIFGSLALTVFYIIRIFKTEQLDQNMKIMWTLLLFFAGMLAQPVFWYLYIWREMPANGPPNQLSLPASGPPATWDVRTATSEREVAYVPPAEPPDWR